MGSFRKEVSHSDKIPIRSVVKSLCSLQMPREGRGKRQHIGEPFIQPAVGMVGVVAPDPSRPGLIPNVLGGGCRGEIARPALGILHLTEGRLDLPSLGNKPLLPLVPNMNNVVVEEGNRIPLGKIADALLLHLLGCQERMLSLCRIVTPHPFEGLFRLVDFPPDILRVEIDRDRVVQKRKRGQRPEDPTPRPLRTPLEDHEIVVEAVRIEPKVFPRLHPLVPAVLMDGFLLPELTDRVIAIPAQV